MSPEVDVPRRPGTVALAAWFVAVPAAVVGVVSLLGGVALLLLGRRVDALVAEADPLAPQRVEVGAMLVVGLVTMVLLLAVAVAQVVLAVRLLRGGRLARLLVVVLQVVHLVVVVPGVVTLLLDPAVPLTSAPTLVGVVDVAVSVLVVVLLHTGRAAAWFAAHAQAERSARASRSSASSITGLSFENVQRTSVRPPPGSSGLS